MPENCNPISAGNAVTDKVCIHTDKVYDACKEKDCLEDLRVYVTRNAQEIVDRAVSVRIKSAEVLWVYTDVEAVPFNKGYYTVDLRYFFRISLDIFTGNGRPTSVDGLATFNKKTILYGSEGNVKIFTSNYKPSAYDNLATLKSNLPKTVVEVVDPIALNAKIVDKECSCCDCDCTCDVTSIPSEICRCFDDELVVSGNTRNILVTLGIFTIVKLERYVQLLMPVCNFCIPTKECTQQSADEDPCSIFDRITFPIDEFFPPNDQTNEAFCNKCTNNSVAGNSNTGKCCCNNENRCR